MANYTKITDFGAKDSLISGDPLKVIRGSEIDDEFDAIATAVASKYDTATANTALDAKADVAGDTFTGPVVLPAGTVSAPSLTFASDTNTGIYSSGADTLDFSTGGAQRVSINTTGLGINTAPSTKLDVNGVDSDGIVARIARGYGATNNPRFEFSTNEASKQAVFDATGSTTPIFYLKTGGTDRLTITNDGRVAINAAANSSYTLSVISHSNSSSHTVFNVASVGWGANLFSIAGDGQMISPPTYTTFTTSNAANVYVNASGGFFRSTSSIKYKTQVEDLDPSYADKLLDFRPVWYRSTCDADRKDWSWYGFIAEELAAIDPRFVEYKQKEDGTLEPEGVQYSRIVVPLVALVQKQQKQIEALEARLAVLEAK